MEKKIVIVGAGSGVSLGIARRFGREGLMPILVSRKAAKLEELAKKLRSEKIPCTHHVADAGNAEEFRSQLEAIIAEEGLPEVAAYNPSILRGMKPLQLQRNTLMQDLQVDVGGAMDMAQVFGPRYIQEQEGTLLFTGGGLALEPFMDYTSLSIGKAALRNYVLTLAQELQGLNVTVGMVTIAGMVKWGTQFDPGKISESFWNLYKGTEKGPEIIFK